MAEAKQGTDQAGRLGQYVETAVGGEMVRAASIAARTASETGQTLRPLGRV